MMKKNLSILFSIIILSAVIGLGVRFVFAQIGWYEPTGTPPDDNEIPLWIKQDNGDLFHTTGGNVGIGTTGPTQRLDVRGWLTIGGHWVSPGFITLEEQSSFHRISFNELRFFDGQVGDMVIFNNGNVGIGTTAPGASLDVGGNPNNAIRTAYLMISANNATAADRPYIRGLSDHLVITPASNRTAGADSNTMYYSYPGDLATGDTVNTRIQETLFISPTGSGGGGNVGIGATNPAGKLDVFSTGARIALKTTAQGTTGTNYGLYAVGQGAGATTNIGGGFSANGATNNYAIYIPGPTGGANNYAIYSTSPAQSYFAGLVGIGITTPSTALDILGNLKVLPAKYMYNYKWIRTAYYTPRCSCDRSNLSWDCGYSFYSNTDEGATCYDQYQTYSMGRWRNRSMQFDRSDAQPSLFTDSFGRVAIGTSNPTAQLSVAGDVMIGGPVGIGTTQPSAKLDIQGDVFAKDQISGSYLENRTNLFQIDDNLPQMYTRRVGRTYVVEVGPSKVGTVVKIQQGIFEEFCKNEVGYRCRITLGMKNWDTNKPNLLASRGPYHFSYTGEWWRFSENDVEGFDGNGLRNEWNVWDCYLTDAETSTNSSNGREDRGAGFGILNVKGGSYSDSSTGCVLIIEDIVGPLVKTGYLVNGLRTETECTNAGGVVQSDSGGEFCKFTGSSCPSPWLQYKSWTTTSAKRCVGDDVAWCEGDECTTSSHNWQDKAIETCNYITAVGRIYGCERGTRTCTANVSEVGCY